MHMSKDKLNGYPHYTHGKKQIYENGKIKQQWSDGFGVQTKMKQIQNQI